MLVRPEHSEHSGTVVFIYVHDYETSTNYTNAIYNIYKLVILLIYSYMIILA